MNYQFEFTPEELGMILTSLSFMHGLEPTELRKIKPGDEGAYLRCLDALGRKICSQVGLPESFLVNLKADTLRDNMRKKYTPTEKEREGD